MPHPVLSLLLRSHSDKLNLSFSSTLAHDAKAPAKTSAPAALSYLSLSLCVRVCACPRSVCGTRQVRHNDPHTTAALSKMHTACRLPRLLPERQLVAAAASPSGAHLPGH